MFDISERPQAVSRFVDEVERLLPGSVVVVDAPLDEEMADWRIRVRHPFGRGKVLWCGLEEVFEFDRMSDEDVVQSPDLAAWKVCGDIVMQLDVKDTLLFCLTSLMVVGGFLGGFGASMVYGVSLWYMASTVIAGLVGMSLTLRNARIKWQKRFDDTMGKHRST